MNKRKSSFRDIDVNDIDYIKVFNLGDFFTKFSVNYSLYGKNVTLESDVFSTQTSKKINYPDDAVNISIKIQISQDGNNFITIFNKNYSESDDMCFKVYGTMKNPICNKIDCDSMQENPIPPIIPPEIQQGYYMVGYIIPVNNTQNLNNLNQNNTNSNNLNHNYSMPNFMYPGYPYINYGNGMNIPYPVVNYGANFNR